MQNCSQINDNPIDTCCGKEASKLIKLIIKMNKLHLVA